MVGLPPEAGCMRDLHVLVGEFSLCMHASAVSELTEIRILDVCEVCNLFSEVSLYRVTVVGVS